MNTDEGYDWIEEDDSKCIVFENPYGWFNTSKPFASSGDSISSDQLSNENTAAKFLSEYRIDSLWKRN